MEAGINKLHNITRNRPNFVNVAALPIIQESACLIPKIQQKFFQLKFFHEITFSMAILLPNHRHVNLSDTCKRM